MKVRIIEKLVKEIEVEATSEREAIEKAKDLYWDGDVVLDADDFNGETEFELVEEVY